jgi:hypothetical protein
MSGNPQTPIITGAKRTEKYLTLLAEKKVATMANGEGWLTNGVLCNIEIVPVANYNHDTPYELPVNPSPNLNTQ